MVALAILLFSDRLVLAGGVWAILSFGDGFSNLLGRRLPLAPIPWNPEKSLGGMLAFLIMGALGAWLIMLWIGPYPSLRHVGLVAFSAAAMAALYETLPLPWDDNVVITLVASAMCTLMWDQQISHPAVSITLMVWALALVLNAVVASAAWGLGWVSSTGASGGALIGSVILAMGGGRYYALLLLFFLVGTLTTQFGYYEKDYLGIAQAGGGKRHARHVLANGCAALLACLAIGWSDGLDRWLAVFYAAALATALGDTVATELGQLYGRNPFLPTSFRRVAPGAVGAISIEGTLFGMAAAGLFTLAAWAMQIISFSLIPAVVIGAWLGFYAESYIASYWIEEGVEMDNEWMNLLNTMIGGSLAIFVATLTGA